MDLRRTLLTTPGLPAAAAWEGRKFVPTAGVPYYSDKVKPLGEVTETVGSDGYTRVDFAYMVTFHYPEEGFDLVALEGLADAVVARYPQGQVVGSAGVFGRITGSRRVDVIPMADRWHLGVRIIGFVRRQSSPSI
jgi:hypothetical protein